MWRRSVWLLAFCLVIGSVAIAQDAIRSSQFGSNAAQSSSRKPDWTSSRLADRLKSLRNDSLTPTSPPAETASTVPATAPDRSILKQPSALEVSDPPAAAGEPVVRASIGDDGNRPPARPVRSLDDLMGKTQASTTKSAVPATRPSGTLDAIKQQAVTTPPAAAQESTARSTAILSQPIARRNSNQLPVSTQHTSPGQPNSIELLTIGPAIQVSAQGPRAVTLNKPADYHVKVSNSNDVVAQNVVVTVNLPPWVVVAGDIASSGTVRGAATGGQATRIVWTLNQLPAYGHSDLKLKLVSKDSRPIDMNVAWQLAPQTSAAKIVVQEPRLAMNLTGPSDVLYGESASYRITVSNPGTGDADNVTVVLPPAFGGGSRQLGTIPAGQQQQFEVVLGATQAGEVTIAPEANADGGLRANAVQRVLVRRAALAVQALGPRFKYAGSTATFRVRVANVGNASAENVMAAVALPANAKYVSGLDAAEQIQQGLRWQIGSLRAGSEQMYEVTCILNQDGPNEFHAGARAGDELAASAKAITTVEALADLKLEVDDPHGPQPIGEEVEYVLKVKNRGTKAARDVKVVMQFSDGVEAAAVGGAQGQIVPGQVIFPSLSRVAAGEEVVLTVVAKASRQGNHVFRVLVNCAEPDARRVSEGTTRFFGDDVPAVASPNLNTFQR